MRALQILDGLQVHGSILADSGMRTAAGLDARHPVSRQGSLADKEFGVFPSVNVIRHDGQVHCRPQALAKDMDERRLAAADRSRDTNPKSTKGMVMAHIRKESSAAPAAKCWRARKSEARRRHGPRRSPGPPLYVAWLNCGSCLPFRSSCSFQRPPGACRGRVSPRAVARRVK